jgi:PAS domain S-box-containing protein
MNAPQRLPVDAITQFDLWAAAVFDHSSLGMLRVAPDQIIIGANRTAAQICGLPSLKGMAIGELLANEKAAEVMERQAAQRMEGLSTEYDIEIFHFPDRRRIPVRVSGMPVISSTGEVLGSLAIVRSLELEHRIQAFEAAIHGAQGASRIFEAVCEQIVPLLKVDFCSFSIYSKSGKHSRMLLSYDPGRRIQSQKRWFPISGALKEWTQRREVQCIDLAEFLNQFPEIASDATVQAMLGSGYRKLLRYPVVRDGRVVASLACLSKDAAAFDEAEINLVKALPIAKALLMALHSQENAELMFRFNLIRDMFVSRTPEKIADVAVRCLAAQYGWESVEVYSIEEASRRVRLLSQWAVSPDYRLDDSYSLPLGRGILGYVYQHDCDVCIDDVTKDPQFKDLYVPLRRATRSELCMPIRVNGRISALLNIEDLQENAFSEEEHENLRNLFDEIGGLFTAAWNEALIACSFESTPSVVLIADTAGSIIQSNPAATALLGFSAGELKGTPLKSYFAQEEMAEAIFRAPQLSGVETGLRRRDGTPVQVLLGSRELEGFGAWMVSARDLSNQKRLAELEALRHMYREIAAQTKTPLSLASAWLQRLQRKSEQYPDDTAAVLQKALSQLKKVDITYERLALYGQDPGKAEFRAILLNAGDLLRRTLANFPRELLSVQGLDRNDLYVRGDAFEIEFAIESTLSYLQRFLPDNGRVEVAVSSPEGRLVIRMEAPFPTRADCQGSPDAAPEAVCQAIRELALGAEIIEKFMQHHHGTFRRESAAAEHVCFQLDLPLVEVEA